MVGKTSTPFACVHLLYLFSFISLGLYAENAMDVARREMAWEVDYLREAKNGQHFR